MSYHFLTGATGLLGSYFLRDCLRSGRRMAVLVRPTKRASALQRIDMLLAHWERDCGHALPRPVVFEGDLSQADLDLDATSLRWISENCQSLIHNAASLNFQGAYRGGEPWLSNVTGTERVLALCRCTGITQFHHVSTAYVCGLRKGRVLESELDVGQTLGNDYERSKLEAEQLIREADFLSRPTFYRPGIIVGDSRTYYTTTYHGFYAALKLAYALVSKVVQGVTSGPSLLASLGHAGSDRKNFVPVDWVSSVIAHIHGCPEHHGKTYHLTAEDPVAISDVGLVIQEAVELYGDLLDESDKNRCTGSWFEESFRSQLAMYRSYWRNDPDFDRTNTVAAAPHLPCPRTDRELLLKLAEFAIESKFGRKGRRRPVEPDFDVQRHMQRLLKAPKDCADIPNDCACVGLQVDGPGGGQWKLVLQDGRLIAAERGLSAESAASFRLDSGTFKDLAMHRVDVSQAVELGRIDVEENGMTCPGLLTILQAAADPDMALSSAKRNP